MKAVYEIEMTTSEALWVAKALLAATLAKPLEIRHHIHWRVLPTGEVVATSSDGFRVHQVRLNPMEVPDVCSFTMPIHALKWLQKAAREFKEDKDAMLQPQVVISVDLPDFPDPLNPGDLVLTVREWDAEDAPQIRFECRLVPGEYPPYWEVIDALYEAREGHPSQIPLARFGAAAALHTETTETPIIRFTKKQDGRDGAALLSFWDQGSLRAEAALMPQPSTDDDKDSAAGGDS